MSHIAKSAFSAVLIALAAGNAFAVEAISSGFNADLGNQSIHILVGQPFATVPTPLGDGTSLRIGYWNAPASAPITTAIATSPRPTLASDGWLRLSRTRLDLEPTTAVSGQEFLSEVDSVRCAESPDCIGLSVKLEKPQRLDVSIFDQLGITVGTWSRHFDKAEIAQRAAGSATAWIGLGWNGRSSQGRLVGSGVYLVRVSKNYDHGEKAEEILKVGIRTH